MLNASRCMQMGRAVAGGTFTLLASWVCFQLEAADGTPISDLPGQWVSADSGDLSMRAYVKERAVGAADSITLITEIRNNRLQPMTILRPFGDPYLAAGLQVKIWNDKEQIKYSGPTADYDLGREAFITLASGESVTGTIDLPPRNYAGSDRAGDYSVRYDYAYAGDWDQKVAKQGVKHIWRGSICSREVHIKRQ